LNEKERNINLELRIWLPKMIQNKIAFGYFHLISHIQSTHCVFTVAQIQIETRIATLIKLSFKSHFYIMLLYYKMEEPKSLTHYEKYKETIRKYQRSNQMKINEYYRNKRYENTRQKYLEKEIRYLESKKY
jgi:hypothetical protein